MTTIARDMMTSPAIVVPPEMDIASVALLLSKKGISAVPVCNRAGKLLGIVSEGDILRPFRQSARQRRDWWLGQLAEGGELPEALLDHLRRDTRTAAEVMAQHVITADETAPLPELAEQMMAHAIKRIPILRDDRVVGIVSRADLLRAIARAPALLV